MTRTHKLPGGLMPRTLTTFSLLVGLLVLAQPSAGQPMKKTSIADWLKQTSDISAEDQVKAVGQKLRELNPGFDGQTVHTIETVEVEGKNEKIQAVTKMSINTHYIDDIRPIAVLKHLRSLSFKPGPGGSPLVDISPLKDLKLQRLDMEYCKNIKDFGPLAKMPLETLHSLFCSATGLEPLRNCPLKSLRIREASDIRSLQPLAKKKLVDFAFTSDQAVAGLDVLKAMPLERVELANPAVSGLELFQGPELKELFVAGRNDNVPAVDLRTLKSKKLTSLQLHGFGVKDLTPLKDSELKLEVLAVSPGQIKDLTPLKEMPLKSLTVGGPQLADLSPLSDLKLKRLTLAGGRVTNLAALQKMPLDQLTLEGCTQLKDLSPLGGLKLDLLVISQTKVDSLKP